MKQSNAIIMALVAFALGFVAGVGYVSFTGPPPGINQGHAPAAKTADDSKEKHREFQENLAAIKKMIDSNPDDPSLLVKAGNLLFDHDRHEDAVEYYKQALKTIGENPNVLTDVGISYRRLGKPEKAVEYFQRARKADPKHSPSALNLGIVFFHDLQKKEEALAAWRTYLELEPDGSHADMIRRVVAHIESETGGN